MKKILFVIPRLANAGTETHLLLLSKGLSERGFDVTICCLFEIGICDSVCKQFGFKIICLNKTSIYDLSILHSLYVLIKNNKYDVVHAYLFGFHYLALLPAKIAGVCLTVSSRRELATWKKLHHHLLENFGNMFVDKVVTCSEAVSTYVLRTEILSKSKILRIYNGIDLEKYSQRAKEKKGLCAFGLKETDLVIGNVANFSIEKNHEFLVEVIKEVKKHFPDIKCLLVGDGYLRRELEQQVDNLGLNKNVIFTGERNDVEHVLNLIDVFLFTSKTEGLPNAILEAMACALPVVAVDAGGISEVISSGKDGIVVNSFSVKYFSSNVIELLNDSNIRKQMGKTARQTIESKFSFNRMITDYEEFYKKATS
ncbi:MAG: glycosyltransferase [Candidatus Omnitrophica bacterium]|nr:glycosyltransferase [Candidatus Omnitrophota bacterium]